MINKLTIDELNEFMIKHGLVIRAIPYEQKFHVEVRHSDKYPDSPIVYNPTYKRDMIRVTKSNGTLGGKFIVEKVQHRDTLVRFYRKNVFDSIQEIIDFINNDPKNGGEGCL